MKNILLIALLGGILNGSVAAVEVGDSVQACALKHFASDQPMITTESQQSLLYLDFWASWCAPCAQSFPFLNQLHHRYHQQGLHIIAINMDENIKDAQQFLTHFPVDFTLAQDPDQQCAKQLGLKAMPSSYLIDRQGVVRYIHIGFRESQEDSIQRQVIELLSQH